MMMALCPRCNRWKHAYVPRGGDGTAVMLRRHTGHPSLTRDEECDGSYRTISEPDRIVERAADVPTRQMAAQEPAAAAKEEQ